MIYFDSSMEMNAITSCISTFESSLRDKYVNKSHKPPFTSMFWKSECLLLFIYTDIRYSHYRMNRVLLIRIQFLPNKILHVIGEFGQKTENSLFESYSHMDWSKNSFTNGFGELNLDCIYFCIVFTIAIMQL